MKTIISFTLWMLIMAVGYAQDQDLGKRVAQLDAAVADIQKEMKSHPPGKTRAMITGYGTAGFTSPEHGNSSFDASFNPIFLWKQGEQILVETELEITVAESETEVELEYGEITYLLNDHVTLGAGLFLSPFGVFRERLHPAWINKLPDAPVALGHDGITPTSELGIQARGALPDLGLGKWNYAVYLSNGPKLGGGHDEEEGGGHGNDAEGLLNFESGTDVNDNKAAGGRLGWLPMPELEIGYSVQAAELRAEGVDPDVLLQGVDVSYTRQSERLGGTLDVRAEWIWSSLDAGGDGHRETTEAHDEDEEPHAEEPETHVEDSPHEEEASEHAEEAPHAGFASGAVVGHDEAEIAGVAGFDQDIDRDGGYIQIAYRPSKCPIDWLQDVECAARYDALNHPGGNGIDQERWTLGVNYWFGPSGVVKFAYQIDDRDIRENDDKVLAQVALGF